MPMTPEERSQSARKGAETRKRKKKDEETLSKLVDWFESAEDATTDARKKSERDRDYYDGAQWTAEEKKELDERGQQDTVFNHVRRKVHFITGHEAETRNDPKAFPRTPQHEEDAEAATDALRYAQDSSDLPEKFSDTYGNIAVEGYGGIEVLYDLRRDKMDIKHWEWDRLFYDPHSAKPDFSDAEYLGGVVWMDEDKAKRKYPGAQAIITDVVNLAQNNATNGETYEDRPHRIWVRKGKRNRVRIVQIYWREGRDWYWAHFTRSGFLEGNAPVPFINEDGDTECPLIMQSAYVNRENERYGEVRELISPQDAINKGYSKWLHSISTRQVIAEKGAVDDPEEAREELARPDGFVERNPGKEFEIDRGADFAAGSAQILLNAKQEMEAAGPNAALQGKQGESASGRAIIASQQGGLAELGTLKRRYKHFRMRVYRQMWNRIRQFWRGEKWIRVADDENKLKFVQLNQPITLIDQLKERAGIEDELSPQQGALLMVDAGLSGADASQVVGIRNEVAKMDMDIILDEAPDTITIQQEQFTEIAKLAGARGDIPTSMLIELSQLRNKDKILEQLKGGGEMTPEQKRAAQEQQEKEEAIRDAAIVREIQQADADIANTEADTAKKEVETLTLISERTEGLPQQREG